LAVLLWTLKQTAPASPYGRQVVNGFRRKKQLEGFLIRFALLPVVLLASISAAQEPPTAARPDPFAPIRFMVGTWRGETNGQPGKGASERSYAFELGDAFLVARNTAVYPPQPKNEKGETHRDTGFISYDKLRKTLVFRQFHSEGFVNQYVLDANASRGDTVVFVTETIENVMPGWRARETYQKTGPNTMVETFELAEPRKEFEVYSVCKLTRVK